MIIQGTSICIPMPVHPFNGRPGSYLGRRRLASLRHSSNKGYNKVSVIVMMLHKSMDTDSLRLHDLFFALSTRCPNGVLRYGPAYSPDLITQGDRVIFYY